MAQTVILKRSAVDAKVPLVGDLELGEIAINTYNGLMFLKKDDGSESIVTIGSDASTLNGEAGSYYLDWTNTTNKPTIDAVPTNGSTNAVQSDGVFDTLAGKEDSLGYTAEDAANKGAVSGYAPLDASTLIPTSYLPALVITDTHVVASEVEQLALTVQKGDVAVRTDESKSYIALNSDNVDMGDWQELLTPTDTVQSVNTYTGAVTLVTGDIAEGVGIGASNLWYTDARVDTYVTGTLIVDGSTAADELWSSNKIDSTIAAGTAHTSTSDPIATNDGPSGYYVGQVWINTTNPETAWVCTNNTDDAAEWIQINSSVGTISGGTNVGTSGVGVFSAVNGSNLEFNKIKAGSTKIGVSLSSNEIAIDVNQGNVDHDQLLNFTADEHFLQSAITTVGTIDTGVWNGTAIVDSHISSAATWNAKQSALTFGIADTNSVIINSASVATTEYAKFTTSGLESKTYAEVKTDLSLNNVENTALTTWTGASTIVTVGTITTGEWNGDTVAIANGGTGATTALDARGNLGIDSADAATDGQILVWNNTSGEWEAGDINGGTY